MTVGHKAIVHACEIGNEVLIGMGAIILDGAKIGNRCIIGANATVTMHQEIPDGSLVLGSARQNQRKPSRWKSRPPSESGPNAT